MTARGESKNLRLRYLKDHYFFQNELNMCFDFGHGASPPVTCQASNGTGSLSDVLGLVYPLPDPTLGLSHLHRPGLVGVKGLSTAPHVHIRLRVDCTPTRLEPDRRAAQPRHGEGRKDSCGF